MHEQTFLAIACDIPADICGVVVYEIDTPAGFIRGSHYFRDPSPVFGALNPTEHLRGLPLHILLQRLVKFAAENKFPQSEISGHFTTGDGISINACQAVAEYIDTLAMLAEFPA